MFAKGTNQMENTFNVVLHLKIEQRYVNYKNFDYIYIPQFTLLCHQSRFIINLIQFHGVRSTK